MRLIFPKNIFDEIEEFQEEEVQLKRGKYGLDDIAAPRKRGRQEVIWHDHELPEKAYPEEHEPQIRLVRNIVTSNLENYVKYCL